MSDSESNTPTIAVSACLLGKPVRYDGGHNRDRFITDNLSQTLDFIPVCPEMEAGLSVPRPTIHLWRIDGKLRLTRSDDGNIDFTEQMAEVALKRAQELLDPFQLYRLTQVPLATPVALLKHHLRKHPDSYLAQQHYLKPYPDSLALRALI